MQMYRSCAYIIIVQIMIDSVKLNSITIYEHKIDLKLYGLTFKVGKCITKTIFLNIEI
jgi:hypothetical protein